MINNWLKIFLHQIRHNKLFTALNILGLSMGISGLVFSILYWNDEHSYNAWNPEKTKVFQVLNDMGENSIWSTNIAPIEPYIKKFPEIESVCYFRNFYFNEVIRYKNKKEQIAKIVDAQSTFFSYFPFEFSKGNGKDALRDNTSIALSEETAVRFFGNEDPMGKQVQYSGRTLTVRGVYKISGKSSVEPMAVTSLIDSSLKDNADQWGNYSYGLMLKLKNPANAAAVETKIEDLYYEYKIKPEAKEEGMTPEQAIKKSGRAKAILEPLENSRLQGRVGGYPEGRGNYQFLLIMVGLSVLILILSIVNYVNLATANAIRRAKEVGVRKVLGASKPNIVKQFIFETVLMTCFSIVLALVIVELSLPFYNDFLGKNLIILGRQFYLQLILIFLIVVILAGIFPAVYVSNFETLKVLKGNFGRSKSGIWLRNGMLIFQFAIASFFIIGSYIVYQQVDYISNKNLGFEGKQVVDILYRYPEEEDPKIIYNKYLTVKEELSKIKGVESVSTGAFTFGHGVNSSSEFNYKDIVIQGQNMAVDFELIDIMKIKIAQGRNLSRKFASDTINSVLVNQVVAKMLNEKNPIGLEINWNDQKFKIVGIVNDFNIYGPKEEIPPMVFFHFKTVDWMSYNLNRVFIKINTENMEQTMADVEQFWALKVDRENPFTFDFVDKGFARTYQVYVEQRNLFSLLNIVVIAIALFGLFALASYSIQRRMKEIAIRKTLGAETKMLLVSLSKQYIVFCIIGFLIALFPVYYLLEKWLENFAFRITITGIPFIIGFLVLLVLTLVIVLSRAYQATRIDVLKYLKYE